MTHHSDLIKWLFENGFEIVCQRAVTDSGKPYTALAARYTGVVRECDLLTSIIGALDTRDPRGRAFLTSCLNDLRNLETSVRATKKEGGHAQIALS